MLAILAVAVLTKNISPLATASSSKPLLLADLPVKPFLALHQYFELPHSKEIIVNDLHKFKESQIVATCTILLQRKEKNSF